MQRSDLIATHFRLVESQKKALHKLRLVTIEDLLYHIPVRHEIGGERALAATAPAGTEVTLYGRFIKLETKKSWKSRIPISEGVFEDGSGRMKAMWFHQPYIAKMLVLHAPVKVVAKISGTDEKRYLANPKVERLDHLPTAVTSLQFTDTTSSEGPTLNSLQPIYPESKGITSLWFYHAVQRIFASGLLSTLEDPLPEDMRTTYHLPTLADALVFVHTPKKIADAEAARKRFAFEEVLCVQLVAQQRRKEREDVGAIPVSLSTADIRTFTSRFPFALTKAQEGAIEIIVHDMRETKPMSRLLEGDVGSGKTAVAATVAYAAIHARDSAKQNLFAQVAYMAPTEVLAKQLFINFCNYFKHLPVTIGLLTGDTILKFPSKTNAQEPTKVSRAQMLKWVASGEVQVLIGTHAVVQKSVVFSNLVLAIIDEQHRFGTMQRFLVTQKHKLQPGTKSQTKLPHKTPNQASPHLLSMTATPIPRTLALTIYGDLDLTLLDAMPPGRKPVITEVVTQSARTSAYARITKELEEGRQAYVICPRIDEADPEKEFSVEAASVHKTLEDLQKGVFKTYRLAAMHSKQTTKEKDAVMADFAAHKIDILVATSVVEVGVNVPNATVILIEGAERFGLAQLHQLRGRVIRSTHQAYCYLVSEGKSQTTRNRLKAITTAKNGFELAEQDLLLRGAGELYGRKQSGLSDIGMDALKNIKMVEAARKEAARLTDIDPHLTHHPLLRARARARESQLHVE